MRLKLQSIKLKSQQIKHRDKRNKCLKWFAFCLSNKNPILLTMEMMVVVSANTKDILSCSLSHSNNLSNLHNKRRVKKEITKLRMNSI